MLDNPIANVLTHCANQLENDERWRNQPADARFSGSDVFVLAHYAAQQIYGGPAIVALERHLKVDQVQHWQTTRQDAIGVLRAAAGSGHTADTDLQAAAMRNELERYRQLLLEAVGLPATCPTDFYGALSGVLSDLRVKDARIRQLTADLERSRPRRKSAPARAARAVEVPLPLMPDRAAS